MRVLAKSAMQGRTGEKSQIVRNLDFLAENVIFPTCFQFKM